MNKRAFTLSLIIAFIAALMVQSYMDGMESIFLQQYGKKVSVVVAKSDIKQFDIIDDRNVTEVTWPSKFKHKSAFSSRDKIKHTIALVPILKGEPITAPRISQPDGTTGLARQVSQNRRAIAIRVNDYQAVSKLIKPGDRVDVVSLVDYAGGRKDLTKVKTILQDVLVLSTGLSITNSLPLVGIKDGNNVSTRNLNTFSNYNTVTLEVDPYQAQRLVFLINVAGGTPYLTLRNNNDKNQVRIKSTQMFDVLDEDSNEAREFFKKQQRGARGAGGNRGGR